MKNNEYDGCKPDVTNKESRLVAHLNQERVSSLIVKVNPTNKHLISYNQGNNRFNTRIKKRINTVKRWGCFNDPTQV